MSATKLFPGASCAEELAKPPAGGGAASANEAPSVTCGTHSAANVLLCHKGVHHGCLLRPAGDRETEPSGGRRLQCFG